jgi:hypothetical protein
MMTHDLARALGILAKVLREAPNSDIKELEHAFSQPRLVQNTSNIAVNLSTLVELSRVDRQQWMSLITEYGFPISMRPRDASRDILGKLLRYLEENPAARQKLKAGVIGKGQASPELMKALAVLLKE